MDGSIYVATAFLRHYPAAFGQKLVTMFNEMISCKFGMPELPPEIPSAESTFQSMEFTDPWTDGNVVAVCHWLRGGKSLQIPPSFRDLMPKRL